MYPDGKTIRGFMKTKTLLCCLAPILAFALVSGGYADAAPAKKKQAKAADKEVTPLALPGSEAFVFRKVKDVELRLHVVKPTGWNKSESRVCLISYFGGGWSSGTPERSITWAKQAASLGMVGIAPDYRTRNRFRATPEDCVSDARAALRWVVEHADELGIDPGPDDPAPPKTPAALILLNPVSDTNASGYGGPKRFDNSAERALACSIPDQMPKQMPPTLIFHATGDTTVPYVNSVALRDKLLANGNRCELVTFQGLGHGFNSSKFGKEGEAANRKTKEDMITFLRSLNLLPQNQAARNGQ